MGFRWAAYLVPPLAEWVVAQVEQGRFRDPSGAIFVVMQVFMEIEKHSDLREGFFRRQISESLEDRRPGIPAKTNPKQIFSLSRWVYRQREVLERLFNRIKYMRDLATASINVATTI